ncbi:hypothetical protein GUITHDRAFT_158122 [Guillardia theta CCMP2712]|uniref:Glutaredoxin domain-containing protein n=1 Tax=Guillardia theta (strain CCMP2712) TaxID=905079 RepID=L1J1U1_GUITC|nr:hypothetical protein GUITHDRAFT_158122 [Guillardia theta CCMP2712]EKX42498.1 hypothetical protein GUITHDRAFT_158122 [Guillardia theta CCMP2712]|eukprot:XP_005829478.1 hypothetical protein GUITHDRAFT_158122 [Guillardia theta CCMP2712]
MLAARRCFSLGQAASAGRQMSALAATWMRSSPSSQAHFMPKANLEHPQYRWAHGGADASSKFADMVKSKVEGHKVMIFSKSYCPYCAKAKSTFNDMGVKYEAMELDVVDNGADIQDTLNILTGGRSVPRVSSEVVTMLWPSPSPGSWRSC